MSDRLVSDIGGLPAGTVPREERRQLFWEKQLIATVNILTRRYGITLDEFRRAAEQLTPEQYAKGSLYDRRLDGWLTLLFEKGMVDEAAHRERTEAILRAGTRDHVG